MNHTHRLVYIALLTALSLALYLLEGLIPMPFLAPGAKLGLANIVTVIALYTLPWRDAMLILILRIAIGSLLGGGPTVMAYSLAGGFLHNLGQLFIAAWAVESLGIFTYLPILGLCGLGTGALIGILAMGILSKLPRSYFGKMTD